MIYVLTNEDLNNAINSLYYVKGCVAGLTNFGPLPVSVEPRLSDIIELLKNIRDCDVDYIKEGD